MIAPALITSEPAVQSWPDGHQVYTCNAELVAGRRPIVCVFVLPFPGMEVPYHEGDRVVCGVDGGTGYVIGFFASAQTNADGNTLFAARTGKDILLGAGAGAAFGWEPFMLYQRAHLDFQVAKSALNAIVTVVVPLMNAAVPGSGDTWAESVMSPTLSDMAAGQPSGGVKGRAL